MPLNSTNSRMATGLTGVLLCLAMTASAGAPQEKWNPPKAQFLKSKQLKAIHLAKAERSSLVAAILAYWGGDDLTPAAAEDSWVSFVDLNGDGVPEVLVSGPPLFCSPTGNCGLLVLKVTPKGYKRIYQRGAVQSIGVAFRRTNRFRDLVLYQHGSAFEHTIRVVRHRKGGYVVTDCYNDRVLEDWEKQDRKDDEDESVTTPCN